jgi:hypothetical protein
LVLRCDSSTLMYIISLSNRYIIAQHKWFVFSNWPMTLYQPYNKIKIVFSLYTVIYIDPWHLCMHYKIYLTYLKCCLIRSCNLLWNSGEVPQAVGESILPHDEVCFSAFLTNCKAMSVNHVKDCHKKCVPGSHRHVCISFACHSVPQFFLVQLHLFTWFYLLCSRITYARCLYKWQFIVTFNWNFIDGKEYGMFPAC